MHISNDNWLIINQFQLLDCDNIIAWFQAIILSYCDNSNCLIASAYNVVKLHFLNVTLYTWSMGYVFKVIFSKWNETEIIQWYQRYLENLTLCSIYLSISKYLFKSINSYPLLTVNNYQSVLIHYSLFDIFLKNKICFC